jgi:hypothetical protein
MLPVARRANGLGRQTVDVSFTDYEGEDKVNTIEWQSYVKCVKYKIKKLTVDVNNFCITVI